MLLIDILSESDLILADRSSYLLICASSASTAALYSSLDIFHFSSKYFLACSLGSSPESSFDVRSVEMST